MKTFCFFQIASVDIFTAGFIQIYQIIVNPRKDQTILRRSMAEVAKSVGSNIDVQPDTRFGDVLNIALLSCFAMVVLAIQIISLAFVRSLKKEDKDELILVVCKDLKKDYTKKCWIMSYHLLYTLRRIIIMSICFFT